MSGLQERKQRSNFEDEKNKHKELCVNHYFCISVIFLEITEHLLFHNHYSITGRIINEKNIGLRKIFNKNQNSAHPHRYRLWFSGLQVKKLTTYPFLVFTFSITAATFSTVTEKMLQKKNITVDPNNYNHIITLTMTN